MSDSKDNTDDRYTRGRCISAEDYGDYDPYAESDRQQYEDLTDPYRYGSSSIPARQPRDVDVVEADPERLHAYILEHQALYNELEITLPTAENLADVLQYEFLVAGNTLMELEPLLAGEPAYENKVQDIMELIDTTDLNNQPFIQPGAPYNPEDYQDTLQNIVEGITATNYEDATDVYLALGVVVNETLDQLETQIQGSPEAVQMLRFFSKLSVFIDLLTSEGVGVLLEDPLSLLLAEAQGLIV